MIPKILLLVEQVGSRASQVNDFRTSISILFQPCTLETIKSITDSFSTTYYAFVLVITEGTFVADSNKCSRSYVGVANWAFSIAFVAKPSYVDT